MGILIDGNFETHDNEPRIGKFGVWPKIILTVIAVFLAIVVIVTVIRFDSKRFDAAKVAISDEFVKDFFLAGHERGEDACDSINLENSYDSCVAYYNDVFYQEYKDIDFEYTIKIYYGVHQSRASIYLKNTSSSENNFNYSEIQFNIVYIKNQDRYYEVDSETGEQVLKNEGFEDVVLFQTIKFI